MASALRRWLWAASLALKAVLSTPSPPNAGELGPATCRDSEEVGEEGSHGAAHTWQASCGQGVGQGHADLSHTVALQQYVARGALPPLQNRDRQGR